ncbi:MAG: hypothetical protein KDK36_19140, partial [Leptospiraceae bacterium]|nr:hypothetical protein [Leptospiraceae bacterium]
MKKLRVLLLVHEELVPPTDSISFKKLEKSDYKTEYQIQECLKKLGHEVHVLGVGDETLSIRRSVEDYKPQVAFNLLEEFAGQATFDQHVVSFLELLNLKYTGCNPQGLMVARNKGLAKKLLKYHRIPTPDFYIFNFKSNLKKLKKLKYPLFVKSLTEEASLGITQESIVHTRDQLKGRIKYFYENYE